MSERSSAKQSLNIYTVMLIISLLALILANVLLMLELQRWGEGFRWWDTTGAAPNISWISPVEASDLIS